MKIKHGTKARLRPKTTGLLDALARFGAGGATAQQLAIATGLRPRQVAARCRWLVHGKLVRYVASQGGLWQLTDDSMFQGAKT